MKSILLTLMLCTALPVWAGSVSFSKSESVVGEVVELIFTSDKPITQAPDLSNIKKDFHISGQNTQTNMTNINGKTNYTYQISYHLFPKRTGTLTLNNLTLNGEKLNNVQLTVLNADNINTSSQSTPPLTLQAQISNGPYYIGQGIVYTLRMGDIRQILDGTFESPSAVNAKVQLLGQDEVRTVMQQNIPVQMVERKYLITPEQSGTITIHPVSFTGMRSTQQNRRKNIGDMFEMGILFDGLMGMGAQEQVFATADPITIQVQPKPSNWQGWWLASPDVQLTYDDKIPTDLKVGDTIERTITLSAVGVNAEALPIPSQTGSVDIKTYPPNETRHTASDDNTIRGQLTSSVVMVPTNGGQITIPEVKVPWFNTTTQKVEMAIIPAKNIMVNGPRLTPQAIQPPQKSAEEIKMPFEPTDNGPKTIQGQSVMTGPQMWLWLIIGLIGGGLIVGIAAFILSKIKTHKRKKPLPDLYPF